MVKFHGEMNTGGLAAEPPSLGDSEHGDGRRAGPEKNETCLMDGSRCWRHFSALIVSDSRMRKGRGEDGKLERPSLSRSRAGL